MIYRRTASEAPCSAEHVTGVRHRRVALITVVVAALTTMMLLATPVAAAESCHKINAKGVGQDLGNGVTVAQIRGGGLLQGTTRGEFAIGDITGTEAAFVGTVVFTTRRSTLTVTVAGALDLATGAFTATGPVTDATGKLAGATGELTLAGVQDFATGTFVEDVTGRICVDLSP